MTQRELNRKGNAEKEQLQIKLKNQIADFIKQTKGLTQKQIYDLYFKHEKIWQDYARRINVGYNSKVVIIHEDMFEEAINNMYKSIKGLQGVPANELAYYNHIAEMFRPRTKWEKFVAQVKKVFNE